jgi:putative transposase
LHLVGRFLLRLLHRLPSGCVLPIAIVDDPLQLSHPALMPQSLANAVMHIVFSTKGRAAWFQNQERRERVFSYLGGVSASLDCPTITVGGFVDHVHILARQSRTTSLAEWIKELKRASTVWIKEEFPDWADFHWQAGYGAFSVSQSMTETVAAYIHDQERHHAKLSFQEEFREILRRHGVTWDEKYVWD